MATKKLSPLAYTRSGTSLQQNPRARYGANIRLPLLGSAILSPASRALCTRPRRVDYATASTRDNSLRQFSLQMSHNRLFWRTFHSAARSSRPLRSFARGRNNRLELLVSAGSRAHVHFHNICARSTCNLLNTHLSARTRSTMSNAHGTSAASGPSWDYQHPEDWKKVPGFVHEGKRQSPINIDCSHASKSASLFPLGLNAVWSEAITGSITNNGRSIQFTPTDLHVSLENHIGTYQLKQFHVHWGRGEQDGSEHQIDGKQCAAEYHFVHEKLSGSTSDGDHLAVIAVLCEEDCDTPIASRSVWDKLMPPTDFGAHENVADLVLRDLLPDDLSYFHYEGSLTTPPCSETVQWFVFQKPIRVPSAFLQALRQVKDEKGQLLQCNCREVQPLNGRSVQSS